jgi:hypothetical protein
MTSNLRRSLPVAAMVATLALASAPAVAESRSAEDLTPAALVRKADAMVLFTWTDAAPGRPMPTLRVDEVLFGAIEVGTHVLPRNEDGREPFVVARDLRGAAALMRTTDGGWGVRAGALGLLSEAEEGAPTAALLRELVTLLRAGDAVPEPARFRAALVTAIDAAPSRVRAGAALDLVRETVALESASDEERARLRRALTRVIASDAGRPSLVTAYARAGGDGDVLADAVIAVGGLFIADAAGEALGARDDGDALRRIAAGSASTSAPIRRAVARALGASRHADARPVLRALLSDGDAEVRREAVLGLGRHRTAEVADALVRRFEGDGVDPAFGERDSDLRRALAWALGQCDTELAWNALRRAAESDADLRVRTEAAAVLRNPRRSFVR